MIKVKNDEVKLQIYKNGKLVKNHIFTNTLTDLYLDYILYRMIPFSKASVLYTEFDDTADTSDVIFSTAYLSYTDQTLTTASTDMLYDATSFYPLQISQVTNIEGENELTVEVAFDFDTLSPPPSSNFEILGFGRCYPIVPDNWLLSYFDLGDLTISAVEDYFFAVIRRDTISSNATMTSVKWFYQRLKQIVVWYGDFTNTYNAENLTYTRGTTGIVEISGLDNFYISTDGLFPSTTLYQSTTLYPQIKGKPTKVEFVYVGQPDVSVFVDMKDLDATYNDKEMTIKIKCERGD